MGCPPLVITFKDFGGLPVAVVALHTHQTPHSITRLCVVNDIMNRINYIEILKIEIFRMKLSQTTV